jgi:hypothetical protein
MLSRPKLCIPVSRSLGRIQAGTGGPPLAVHAERTDESLEGNRGLSRPILCNCYSFRRAPLPIHDRRDTPAGSGGARARTHPRFRSSGPFSRFPVRLDLVLGTGKLEADGTKLIDFVITNIGAKPITLPVSIDWNIPTTHVLTLYLTVVGGSFPVDHLTSAELFGGSGNSQTFFMVRR